MATYGTISPALPPDPNRPVKNDEEQELPLKLSDEISVTLSIISITATLAKLKQKMLARRIVDVTGRMECNSANLVTYTSRLSGSSQQWVTLSVPEEDKLTSRMRKVLCTYSYLDAGNEVRDDGHSVASSIIFASGSGGKPSRPLKLAAQANVPPYTTWTYLDRNQRMTEDQSVQGRRRIYYDPIGNETLIASDSEEEEAEAEDPKHEFSRGEDFIIWSAVQERGPSALLFEQIEECLHVNRIEIQARYEVLQKDADKQPKCEAHGKGLCLQFPSPSCGRKGTRARGCLPLRDSANGAIVEPYTKAGENGVTLNLDEEKCEAKDLVEALDSFDNLFCRRCLVFDCRLHGCSQDLVHPSDRQPVASMETEGLGPCGPHCYKLSNHAGSERSNSFALLEAKVDSSTFPAEVSDRVRVVKRQKILDCETRWIGERRMAANCNGTATVLASANALHISSSHVNVVSKTVKSLDGLEVGTTSISGYEEASHCLKREQLVSRFTSHQKLARTSKNRIKENGVIFDDSVNCQGEGNPSKLAETHGGDFKEDGTRAMKKLAEDGEEKLVNGITKSENLQQTQGSKDYFKGEAVIPDHEKDGFSLTTKLARIGKRPLEENMITYYERKGHVSRADETESGQDAGPPKGQDYMYRPSSKKLARAINAVAQVKVIKLDCSDDVEKVKYWGNGADPFKEKSDIISPKRLDARERESGGQELVEKCDERKAQTKLYLGESSKDMETALNKKLRNTAAKKLARSSRKALAEKVAGAIQQQQMLSKRDKPHRSTDGKQPVDEDGDSGSEQSSEIVNTVSTRPQELLQPTSATAGRNLGVACALGLSESNREPEDSEGCGNGIAAKSADAIMIAGGLKVSKSEPSLEGMEAEDGWTALEKGLYEKGSEIFGKNSCMIANITLKGFKTCAEVGEYIAAQEASLHEGELGAHEFPDSLGSVLKWGSMDVARARARFYGRRRGSRKLKFTLKSAGQSAIRKRMGFGKDVPCRQYSPCGCLYTCGKQCPCQLSGTCCEKYCGCAKGCKNRFRGCHCAKSQCCSRQCPCFAAGRECDPDVCRNCWIGCGDGKVEGMPQREDKDNYQCHNMKLLLKQRQRVLLSKSDVAGWGAFLRRTVSKHEFLGEYTGELISHREADKRGKIYDRENSSFLFNLNDQYVLDACRKGDKLKFANHSPNPNCYAKVIMVAGDHRVGIFAKERILAGEELFYDYRYEAERAPAWASRADDSTNGKKEDAVGNERRLKHAS